MKNTIKSTSATPSLGRLRVGAASTGREPRVNVRPTCPSARQMCQGQAEDEPVVCELTMLRKRSVKYSKVDKRRLTVLISFSTPSDCVPGFGRRLSRL